MVYLRGSNVTIQQQNADMPLVRCTCSWGAHWLHGNNLFGKENCYEFRYILHEMEANGIERSYIIMHNKAASSSNAAYLLIWNHISYLASIACSNVLGIRVLSPLASYKTRIIHVISRVEIKAKKCTVAAMINDTQWWMAGTSLTN